MSSLSLQPTPNLHLDDLLLVCASAGSLHGAGVFHPELGVPRHRGPLLCPHDLPLPEPVPLLRILCFKGKDHFLAFQHPLSILHM